MVAIGTSSVDRLARSKRPIVERTEIHIPPAPQLSSEAVTGPTANRLSAVSRFNTDLQKWRNDAWAVEMPGQPDFALQADVATLRADTKAMIANIATNTLNITNIQTDITNLTTAITEIDNSITTIDNRITIIEGNAITGTGIVQANGANPPTAILGTPGHVPYWTSVGPPYISLTSPIYTDGTSVGIGTDLPAVLLDVGLAGTTPGVMRLSGGTSGNVTIQTAAAAGAWTLTLPVNDGAANEFLKTNGTGVTSWSSVVLTTDVTGILPVANGGTNKASWTPGSVAFAGAGGLLLTEDNANLFYDDSLNRFGVGTNTPSTELTVASTSASDPRGIMSAQYSTDAVGARIHFRKARGTEALPTTVVTGDVLGRIRFSGYDGANYLQMGSIDVGSSGTIGATRVPTYMSFSTATNVAPSVLTERMRINNEGKVGIGITGPIEVLEVGGVISPRISVKSNATNSDMGILFQTSDLSRLGAVTYNAGVGNALEFRTSGTNAAATRAVLTTNLSIGLGAVAGSSRLHVNIDDAVTTVTDVLRINHSLNTGGTAANFGTGILLTGETSTTDAQDMARIQTIWTTATHATRTSAIQFQTVNSAAALATQVWIQGNGDVGIGISPTTKLHVYSASGNVIQYIHGPTSGQETSLLFIGSGGNWKIGQQNNILSGSLAFALNSIGSPLVLISRTGNVGIGMGANVPGALLDLGLAGTTLGVMRLAGSTSGNVTIQPQAVAGTWTLQLPQNDGALGEFLTTDGAGITSWSAGVSVTPSALTRVDDTNITLTLGGSPTVALLAATSLTLGWAGVLSVARGGTNNGAWSGNSIPVLDATATQFVEYPFFLYNNVADMLQNGSSVVAWRALELFSLPDDAAATIGLGFWFTGNDATNTRSQILFGKEQLWTGTASTRDSYISLETVLDNVTGQALGIRSSGSIICGKDSNGTTRTDDFTYICTSNGPPTGVPTGFGNRVPITFDPNTDTFYIYRGGWKGVVVL